MTLKIERQSAPRWLQPLLPLLAVAITFTLTSAFVLLAGGADPLSAYYYFLLLLLG